MRFEDFVDEETGEEPWLVKVNGEELFPAIHKVLIAGSPGQGKSTLLAPLAITLSSGISSVFEVKRKHKVLLIDEDTPTNELRRNLQLFSAGMGIKTADCDLEVWSMKGYKADSGWKSKIDNIAPDVVITECLTSIKGNLDPEGKPGDMRAVWDTLSGGGKRSVVLTHHFNKSLGDPISDFNNLVRGSGDIVASCDTGLACIKLGDNPTRFGYSPISRRRLIEIAPFTLELVEGPGTKQLKYAGPLATGKRASEDTARVFLMFQDNKSRTVLEVKMELHGLLSDPKIRDALNELEQHHILILDKGAHNRYRYSISTSINSNSIYYNSLLESLSTISKNYESNETIETNETNKTNTVSVDSTVFDHSKGGNEEPLEEKHINGDGISSGKVIPCYKSPAARCLLAQNQPQTSCVFSTDDCPFLEQLCEMPDSIGE